jgi:hypothetical protein
MKIGVVAGAPRGERAREGRRGWAQALEALGVEVRFAEEVGAPELSECALIVAEAAEPALGGSVGRCWRVPAYGRAAELARWSERARSEDEARFARELAAEARAERRIVAVFAEDREEDREAADAGEQLARRGSAGAAEVLVVRCGARRGEWITGDRRGRAAIGLDLAAQRSLLACADLALLGAGRAGEDGALWLEAAAHGAVPLIAGTKSAAEGADERARSVERHLRAWLGPRRMTALLSSDRGACDLAARARALLAHAADDLPALSCVLREAARESCDWAVRARCLAQRAAQRCRASRSDAREAERAPRP